MQAAFHHEQWHRVAALAPQLAPHLRCVRHRARGERWIVLVDDHSGRSHRLNEAAWQVVGRCDGRSTLQSIWEAAVQSAGEEAPTQGETIQLVARLSEQGLIRSASAPEVAASLRRRGKLRADRVRQALNPFAIRVPLFDPDAFLGRTQRFVEPLFTRRAAALWCVLAVWAIAAFGLSPDLVGAYATRQLADSRGWLVLAVCYPLMKLLHELGHAYAIRRAGGEVHAIGVTWMLVVPLPWVDGSASASMPRRRDRLLVSGIGIGVELGLAFVATIVWCAASDGLLREIAFAVMSIGTLSTLLFNANPLMRFDGYYLLVDALDLPNLATRSQAMLLAVLRRHGLRMSSATLPQTAPYEAAWLLGYGVAALVYRWVLTIGIVFWVAGYSALAALGIAAYAVVTLALVPGWRGARWLLRLRAGSAERWRARGLALGGLASLVVLIGLVPAPHCVVADAVVWLPDDAQVRAAAPGTVVAVRAADGERVGPDQPLLELDNAELVAERAALAARLASLDVEHYRSIGRDPAQAMVLAERIVAAQADLEQADARLALLQPKAAVAGTLAVPRRGDLEGSWVAQGTPLAYVLAPSRTTLLRAVLDDADAEALRGGVRGTAAWIGADAGVRPARLVRQRPGAARELPSAALGQLGGGSIPVDPADASGRTALAPVFVADIEVDLPSEGRIGSRARVRFALPDEPLARRWGRGLARTFLRQAAPGTL